jgi:sensor histidine kinase YesM
MRKLWKKGIFIFLVILFMMAIIFLGFVVIGHKCTDYDDSRSLLVNNLENAISQYQAGEISVIDFSSLTDFTWDRLFIFGPYTSSKTINNNLGTYWPCSHFTRIFYIDSMSLFVFTNNGHVVQHLDFPRTMKEYLPIEGNSGYSVEETIFIVDERGRLIWVGQQ